MGKKDSRCAHKIEKGKKTRCFNLTNSDNLKIKLKLPSTTVSRYVPANKCDTQSTFTIYFMLF